MTDQSKQREGVRLCFECRGSGVVGMYPDKRPCVVCGGTGDRAAKEGARMSYEVYIDVKHHPRHLEDYEEHHTHCGRFSNPEGADPSEAERMRAVVGALRGMADKLDPDWHCTHCDKPRSEHWHATQLPQCFGRYGPVTQWSWWREVERLGEGRA